MSDPRLTLTLTGDPDAPEELEEQARRLRDDLLELDVEAVDPGEKEAPDGSKVGVAIDWNTIFVTLATSGTLTAIVAAIQAWLLRNKESSVTIKRGDDELVIAGPGPYSEEQKQAIAQWLNRNKGFVLPNE
jgi:hypothetical protein